MTDFFAQSLQAFQERMRTPWIGSILIAFLLWNWQPLLFLVASDTALLTRFNYFEIHTDWRSLFAYPIATGFVFAALKQWISLGMDWLGAWAIHRSKLHADRLAEDRSFKRLDLQAASLKKKAEIENEIVDHAIERKTKIEGAQLNEDEKEQVQQDLDALQSTREKEDVDPIDDDTRARAVVNLLDEHRKNVLRGLARLERGVAQVISKPNEDTRLIDLKSGRTICELNFNIKSVLGSLESYKLVETYDHELYKITEFGRKVARLSHYIFIKPSHYK